MLVDAGHHYLELRGVEIRGTIEVVGDVPQTAAPNGELAPVELQFAASISAAARCCTTAGCLAASDTQEDH